MPTLYLRLDEQRVDVLIKILGGFIDVDKGRHPFVLGNRCTFLRRLADQGDKKAAENLSAFLFEEVFCGVDEDEASPVHFRKEIDFVALIGKHAVKHRGCQNGQTRPRCVHESDVECSSDQEFPFVSSVSFVSFVSFQKSSLIPIWP